ncbi:ISKra4 family transposase [bacterium]|nr:ISKra4 family transposase [bacterium]
MQAFTVEQSILEGEKEVKELFDFVRKNAADLEAYRMEQTIFFKVMQIGLAGMKCYFAEKGTGDVGNELILEDGKVLKKEGGLRGQDYFSVFGKLKVPRTYYRLKGEAGIMPLDAQANLPERCYSYLLQEWMDLFSIRESFKESEVSLEKLLGLKVSQSCFETVNRKSSESYDEFYKDKQPPAADSEGEIQVLGFDGKGVPVIKEEAAKLKARQGKGEKRQKKKEAMVGVSYTIDQKKRTPSEVAENLIYPERAKEKEKEKGKENNKIRAQNIRRMASLERAKKEVMEEMVSDATNRDPGHKRPLVVTMDGALHLWDLAAKTLSGVDFVGVLDIIHVVEYLWKAGNALYGEKTSKGKLWVYNHLLSILQGRVGWVIGGLKQTLSKQKLKAVQRKALEETIRYFENHREWMKYNRYLKAGYPIGTGVVESSCGHTVKDRMEGTGRRWSIKGAESTLLLRSVYTSNDWDAYWQSHMATERKRLYYATAA